MDFGKYSKSAKEDCSCCPLFLHSVFLFSIVLSLHTLNDLAKAMELQSLVVGAHCRLLQYEHELKTKLFLSSYITEMVIHSQGKHLMKEAVIRRCEPHLYPMDIPYVNVNEVFLPVLIKNHWTLYVYDLSNKKFNCYILDLAKVVLWLATHKKNVSPYELRTFNFLTPNVPLQPNE
ncbi:hypothetical protein CK203_049187 [Vitis vinifera]|uniref:Ubiquitin-like protease family profile domain-containing protein n=1 Tax=Vitis vinifera TaxID=29760 RepID=A0A438GV55_VITVI|nr:hypothetical protein CK203_049187 [Vitis vinifera]